MLFRRFFGYPKNQSSFLCPPKSTYVTKMKRLHGMEETSILESLLFSYDSLFLFFSINKDVTCRQGKFETKINIQTGDYLSFK